MMDDDEESFQERQQNERVCLSAIYMDDFRDETNKNDRGMDVSLHLMPQLGMSGSNNIHVTVDMRVSCPPRYPSVLPEIRFENARGLSVEKIQSLKSNIDAMAKRLKGEEMILQLAQAVQQFLHSHNVPGMKSFFDEMQKKAEREREKDALLKQKEMEQRRKVEERERKELEEEMLIRQEALHEESRQRREKSSEESSSPKPGQHRWRRQPDPIDFVSSDNSYKSRASTSSSSGKKKSPDASSDAGERQRKESFSELASDSQVITVKFKTKSEEKIIHRGCILDDQEGGLAYIGMDASNGHLCVIREWDMKWKHGKGRKPLPDEEKSASNCQKQLSSVEQELHTLMKLSHPNLVHYRAMSFTQGKDSTTVQRKRQRDKMKMEKEFILLMMEFVGSATLRHQIRSRRRVPFSIIRQYTIDILSALSYLHKKAVVHKQLSPGSVFLDVSGQLRLANYSICRRLNDLYEVMSEEKHSVRFSEEKSFGARGGKKADVLKFGLILLGILKEDPDVQLPCEIPSDIPGDLQDFLHSCLDTDERNRASINNLEEHPFVKHALPSEVCPDAAEKKELNGESPYREDLEAEGGDVRLLSNSRLHMEFEVLGNIGKGGFGNVYKVRNRLDGNAYAIKRIVLNPKSKELNKKITREVKLLSRLNHENVVRYFNSWIEVSDDILTTESESDPSISGKPEKDAKSPTKSFGLSTSDNVEELAPRLSACGTASSWSVSTSHQVISEDDSSISSDDEDDYGMSFMRRYESSSESDGIEFEREGAGNGGEDQSQRGKPSPSTTTEEPSTDMEISPTKYLYIQMEFCEKSTLRTSILQEIYKDEKKLWSFFRQILEGLVHVHSQGMIHRDLKPDNVFLASDDMVKIGDFGLATSEQKAGKAFSEMTQRSHSLVEDSQSEDDTKDFLTGKVGTALYVSPELCGPRGGYYNQKVDLYSLGIIFFEMCSPPLATGMERVKMLGKLRQETIEMPEYFSERGQEDKKEIIKWLLDHEPAKRPTAKELLESPHLPPLEMEEARFQEMIGQTVSNDKSRGFKHLMDQLFSQTTNETNDVLYDMDNYKGFSLKQTLIQRTVYESLTRLFEKHGAVKVMSPLLMPKNTTLNTESCTLMDSSGGLVMLPFDLRIPFARNIARNVITKLKRYAIQKVYRERKINRCHPRELTECAFDIVTNITTSVLPDAEAIYIVSEIIEEFPALEEKKHYFIRINHSSLLKAILSHCGIQPEKHEDVLRILRDAHMDKAPIETQLAGLSLSEQEINSLVQYIELECSLKELSARLKPLTRNRGANGSLAKQALHELEAIISQAEIFGVRQKIVVTPNLVHKYYSGLVFQFVALLTHKSKKQVTQDKLAAGGRYDHLIPMMRLPSLPSSHAVPKAVGVSINFDKIVAALLHDEEAIIPVCDVLVCVMSSSYSIKECIQVVRNLWNSNIKADILYDASMSLEDIQDYCRTFKVSHIVLLKDHLESGMVWVRSIDQQRVVDSKVAMNNLVESLQQKLSSYQRRKMVDFTDLEGRAPPVQVTKSDLSERAEPVMPQRSQSFDSATMYNQAADFSLTLLPIESHRLENNHKKRIERQMQPRIAPVLEHLSSKVVVEVVAVDLPMEVVKNIVAILDLEGDESSFDASVQELCNKYNKYRKYLPTIADSIQSLKEKSAVVLLYSYREDGFKVFL